MFDLPQEIAGVRAELGRADTKASTLLGLAGTATSIIAALATVGAERLPVPGRIALWAGVGLLAAVAVLLLAVRPSLPRPGCGVGWTVWAGGTTPAPRSPADREREQVAELVAMSRLAYAKHAHIRRAVHLLLAALAVLAAVVPLGVA